MTSISRLSRARAAILFLVLVPFLALVAVLVAPGPAVADVFRGGDFRVTHDDGADTLTFSALIPHDLGEQIGIGVPADCGIVRLERYPFAGRMQLTYTLRCARPLTAADHIATPWRLDAARLTIVQPPTPLTLTLTRAAGGMQVPLTGAPRADRSWPALAGEFLRHGIVHIGLGWDHLAFIICLCLMIRGPRLLLLITAFTLGHSLSLGLAFFEVLTVPMAPVEAVIALSIVVMARDALRGSPTTLGRPMLLVTGFGLLHGLGFASALGEFGVSQAERWPALLFFNLGVEIGQLAFVAALLLWGLLLGRLVSLVRARTAVLYGVGGVGAFWVFERIAAFLLVQPVF
jgi:hypothetical protein